MHVAGMLRLLLNIGCDRIESLFHAAGGSKPKEGRTEILMKTILVAMLVAIGLGLAGTTGASAAPANGAAINGAINMQGMIEQAQYYYRPYRYRYRGPRCRSVRVCRGYGYYRRCWWERRCY